MRFLGILSERLRANDTAGGSGDREVDRDLGSRPERHLAAV